jgi:hypothetical protein
MGILSRLLSGPAFDVFSAHPGRATAARYGRIPVPGEATLELPAALVRIYYEVDGGAGSTFHPPADLVVEVHDAAGVEVPIRKKLRYGRASHRTWGGEGRTYVGRIELPRAGAYVVTARRTAVGIHENPRVCLGD